MGKPFEVGIQVPLTVTLDIYEQTKTFSGEGEPDGHSLSGSITSEGIVPNETFTSNHDTYIQEANMAPTEIANNMQDVFEAFVGPAINNKTNEIIKETERLTSAVVGNTLNAYLAGVACTCVAIGGAWIATNSEGYVGAGWFSVSMLGGAGLVFSHARFKGTAERDILRSTIDIQEFERRRTLLQLILKKGTIVSVQEGEYTTQQVHGGAEM